MYLYKFKGSSILALLTNCLEGPLHTSLQLFLADLATGCCMDHIEGDH